MLQQDSIKVSYEAKFETSEGGWSQVPIIIDKERCPQNHVCPAVRVCPVNALMQKGYQAPVVNQEKCIECNQCVHYCPMEAIERI